MRRDGTMSVVNVKVERTSTEKAKESTPEPEPARPVRIKKEKIDDQAVAKVTAESNAAKTRSSHEVISQLMYFTDQMKWILILRFEINEFCCIVL